MNPVQSRTEAGPTQVSISIVSHQHGALILKLLSDLNQLDEPDIEVLLTVNIPESGVDYSGPYRFPVREIHNELPKGFAANHNAAFRSARGEYFCVMNPDIRLPHNPFPALQRVMHKKPTGIAAPRVVNASGLTEDSARPFPRFSCLVRKVFGKPGCSCYPENQIPVNPDWVGGMFMLFRREVFAQLNGFNEAYFLYYEDVDICARARILGLEIVYCREVSVMHDARRDSHRKLKFLIWHLTSMMRFLASGLTKRATARDKQQVATITVKTKGPHSE